MSNFRIEPSWCPLKINSTTVNFEEYEVETKNQIHSLNIKINKLESGLDILSEDEIEYEKITKELSDLYKVWEKLLENKCE